MSMQVRRAEPRDIPAIMELLVQVNMVHHNGRPDLFKGPTTKYTASELMQILLNDDTPVFVCVDGDDAVLGHGFCVLQHAKAVAQHAVVRVGADEHGGVVVLQNLFELGLGVLGGRALEQVGPAVVVDHVHLYEQVQYGGNVAPFGAPDGQHMDYLDSRDADAMNGVPAISCFR